jgi:hypothetical protein
MIRFPIKFERTERDIYAEMDQIYESSIRKGYLNHIYNCVRGLA